MQAHILYTPWNSEWGQKSKHLFLKEVILHIKLTRMQHRAPCKQIFCPYIHPQSLAWGHKAIKFFLLKVVMLHIKLKGLERREPYKAILCPLYIHPGTLGGIKGQNIFFSESIMLHIKLIGVEQRAPCKHIYIMSLQTPSTPGVG